MELGIIGGTGLTSLANLQIVHREVVHTPFGEPSAPLVFGKLAGKDVVFLARHGSGHTIPPHRINYRANIWAIKNTGAAKVVGVAAVGGIAPNMKPGMVSIPDQLIDYTWGRPHTFFEENLNHVTHVDFTYPYSSALRQKLIAACRQGKVDVVEGGTYGAMQGPRLETAAEINRIDRDGCTMVGMTGMPEAALAREMEMEYATCAVVANWAAGRAPGEISMEEIEKTLRSGMAQVRTVLEQFVPML